MALYLVYTGWQGNGEEGVIVDAHDPTDAVFCAYEALTDVCRQEIARRPEGTPSADEARRKLANYEQYRADWRVEEITLPYIGEFG